MAVTAVATSRARASVLNAATAIWNAPATEVGGACDPPTPLTALPDAEAGGAAAAAGVCALALPCTLRPGAGLAGAASGVAVEDDADELAA